MKRIIAAIVIALAIAAVPGVSVFASEDGLLDDYTDKTVVLQSNDVHGAVDKYQYMAGLRDELEKRGADVIVVDCGDYIQGSKEIAANKGENAIRMMNKVKYDLATIGNHEFDFSYTRLKELMKDAQFDIICDNIVDDKGAFVFDATKVIEVKKEGAKEGDVKVGFVGVTTPETQTKTSPSNLENLTVLSGKSEPEIFEKVGADITELDKNADVVLCLSHLGIESGSAPYRSYDLWNNMKGSGLDYILDGHSHTVMESGKDGEPIISTGTKFEKIGVITIDEKTKAIDKEAKPFLYEISDSSYSNKDVKAESDKIYEEIDEVYKVKVGTSEVELNGERNAKLAKEHGSVFQYGNRDGETNFGDFAADAVLWYALKDGKEYDVPEDHIIGVYNGGSVRAGISKGDVTRGDVLSAFPFFNPIEGVYVTGRQILEALEASTYCYPEECGGFPQVAGIEYTIDSSKEFEPADEQYPESVYYPPKTINRVTIDTVNGKQFSLDDTYLVVTNSFITDGGDSYGAFKNMPKITINHLDEEVFAAYIKEGLGGVIGEQYKEPKGRVNPSLDGDEVALSSESFTYNGKVRKPSIKTIGGRELVEGKDYTAKWSNESSKKAGTYTVTITGAGGYTGQASATYKINKAANTLKVKGRTYKIKASKLRARNKKVKAAGGSGKSVKAASGSAKSKIVKVTSVTKKIKAARVIKFINKGQGKKTYTKVSGTKKITVSKKTGKMTLKKGLKKGTYTIKVKVKAAGTANYKASKPKTVKIKVRIL